MKTILKLVMISLAFASFVNADVRLIIGAGVANGRTAPTSLALPFSFENARISGIGRPIRNGQPTGRVRQIRRFSSSPNTLSFNPGIAWRRNVVFRGNILNIAQFVDDPDANVWVLDSFIRAGGGVDIGVDTLARFTSPSEATGFRRFVRPTRQAALILQSGTLDVLK